MPAILDRAATLRCPKCIQQARSRHAPIDRTARCRRLDDTFAVTATQLRPDDPDHFESRRHKLEKYRYVFAELVQRAAALGARGVPGFRRDGIVKLCLKALIPRIAAPGLSDYGQELIRICFNPEG